MAETIEAQNNNQVHRNLIIQELQLLTRQGKIKWFLLHNYKDKDGQPKQYFFKAMYNGIQVELYPDSWDWGQDVIIRILDIFGGLTQIQLSFQHEKRDELIKLIESTNPALGDIVHNNFFPRDRRSVEEQVLGQLLIGRTPLV